MTIYEESLQKHEAWRGKYEINPRIPLHDAKDLALAYTPGVAEPCLQIQKDKKKSFTLTRRWNSVAVITDGSAVLGLGDIGPEAAMPVMEGKCVLFKAYGDVDAFPLCIGTQDVDEIVRHIQLLSGSFGGINLEDISAPRCFEIEERLKQCCDIPVFHDDQHGTAIVVCAALINALKLTNRSFEQIRVVQNGPGAAGTAIIKMLKQYHVKDILAVDEYGILYEGRSEGMDAHKKALAKITNAKQIRGTLQDALVDADVFIGTSVGGCLHPDMIQRMHANPIIFACANPTPEIFPDEAIAAGAAVVCTGRSDFPNQVNNVLVFPGIFRGALDAQAKQISESMKIAAAYAIAEVLPETELDKDHILPTAFDPRIKDAVANAVRLAAYQED